MKEYGRLDPTIDPIKSIYQIYLICIVFPFIRSRSNLALV
jgi:hypothetical protein